MEESTEYYPTYTEVKKNEIISLCTYILIYKYIRVCMIKKI